MGKYSRKSMLLALLLLLVAADGARGQWTKGPQAVVTQHWEGAIAYKDGMLWAGAANLASSTDSGRTWTQMQTFGQSDVTDISFLSRDTVAVGSVVGAIAITVDGGKSWLPGNALGPVNYIFNVAFDNTLDTVFASNGIYFMTSTDAGANWLVQGLPFGYSSAPFAVAKDGTVYIESCQPITGGYGGSLFYSKVPRLGLNAAFGTFNMDSWSIALDSCDQRRIYVTNEDTINKGDGTSNMYYSTNAGGTWQSGFAHKQPYMNGSLAIGQHALYAGTLKNGIIRSTDQGVTWKNIGGPSNGPDCRYICAINDNIVIAYDEQGYIWSTFNSGGDSVRVTGIGNPNLTLSSSTLFETDTISCDSLARSIMFTRSGCSPPSVDSAHVIGMDSASFRVSNLSPDSIEVMLRLVKIGDQHAQLVLRLDNGLFDTVALAGHVTLEPDTLTLSASTLFATDIISCDSLTYPILFKRSGCSPPKVVKDSVIGVNSASYKTSMLSKDSVLVTLYGIKQGDQHAKLILTLDNGSFDTVELAGKVNITPAALTLSTQDVKTDTLGATVAVPITINGLEHSEAVELVLHYDGAVDYLGSFSPSGAKLDVAGEQWPGRSLLHISGVPPRGAGVPPAAGYAKFNAWNDSNAAAHATFDSLNVLTAISPCEYGLPEAATSTISAPSGCGTTMLSQLVHLGRQPKFTVQPNPTEGDVSISSSLDLGAVTIAVYDMLGAERSRWVEKISGNAPVTLALPEADGVYTIVLQAAAGTYNLRVVRH